jgi:hypothetical protein
LEESDAVRAWRLVVPGAETPAFVDRLTMGSRKRRSEIYRLGGAGPDGADVIAKSERPEVIRTERFLYEDVLPGLGLGALRCYGALEQEKTSWIFLEDAGGERFSESDPVHQAAAANWMGALHVASSRRPDLASHLSAQGPGRYLEHLRRGRSTILSSVGNREIKPADAAVLDAVLRAYDRLEAEWDEFAGFCDSVPQCLVHGDFVGKNAQVRRHNGSADLVLLDWQTAGWGAPAPDVMRLDPVLYQRAVGEAWPHLELEDIDELRRIGTVFRAVAAIDWESRMLAYPWVDGALRNIQSYEGWLYLAGRGASYRTGSVGL